MISIKGKQYIKFSLNIHRIVKCLESSISLYLAYAKFIDDQISASAILGIHPTAPRLQDFPGLS